MSFISPDLISSQFRSPGPRPPTFPTRSHSTLPAHRAYLALQDLLLSPFRPPALAITYSITFLLFLLLLLVCFSEHLMVRWAGGWKWQAVALAPIWPEVGVPAPWLTPMLLPQRCVLKGPKMLHWLSALSGLVATRPGLRVALGTATILLVFAMAITSLVRAEGALCIPIRSCWTCQRWLKGDP